MAQQEKPRKATRSGQLQKAQKIRDEAKLALSESPNAMVKYRLELVLALAEDMVVEAQGQGSGGAGIHKTGEGSKERGY